MQFDYTIETALTVDEAVAAIEAKANEIGFGVLHTHNVQAVLAGKGFDREPLWIIEVCNARYAHEVLAKDVKIALMLPCPISVYAEGGKVFVSTLRPSIMVDFYPDADLGTIAAEVEAAVVTMVDAAR